jgi:hypothetical protein
MTPADREKRRKKFHTCRDAWLKRKRQCLDVVGNIAEAMEKKNGEMEKLIGIETDEAAACQVPPLQDSGTRPPSSFVTSKFRLKK